MENEEVIIVNDTIDLKGAPHTICEVVRESLSTVPEKTEEELYAQPAEKEEEGDEGGNEEEGGEEEPSTPNVE